MFIPIRKWVLHANRSLNCTQIFSNALALTSVRRQGSVPKLSEYQQLIEQNRPRVLGRFYFMKTSLSGASILLSRSFCVQSIFPSGFSRPQLLPLQWVSAAAVFSFL